MSKRIVPEEILPKTEIENCGECRFFQMWAGYDGEYYCRKTMKNLNYADALEEIDPDCPLEKVGVIK